MDCSIAGCADVKFFGRMDAKEENAGPRLKMLIFDQNLDTMRAYAGLILIAAFLGWVLYRVLVKRDLKQHLDAMYVYLFFVGVWVLLYTYALSV